MAKYVVSGIVSGKNRFSIEVEAESERHAERLALSKIGSSQSIGATRITIIEIKKG